MFKTLIAAIRRIREAAGATPPQSARFDWLMTVLGLWFAGGVFLDGWAHNHLASALETFFTPWHAVMYSGFTACALALAVAAVINRRRGYAWSRSLPAGYMPSLAGAGIFAAGGGFDLFWHLTFGIEKNIEALLSPAHLILALGAVLVVGGPFRAAWRRSEPPKGLIASLPMLLSMTFMLSLVTFMTQFAHPVRHAATGVKPDGTMADVLQGRAAAGFVMQTALLAGFALLAVRRWGRSLPMGAFAVVFGANMFGMSQMTDEQRLVWGAILAGLAADWMNRKLAPSIKDPVALRRFGAKVPMVYALAVFMTLLATEGVWWSVHMWSGVIVISGVAGYFLAYLLAPPPMPFTSPIKQ
ncbi:MAG TPA: hypothetical protein VL426_04095 [Candidatus Binatia bacterium]|jgi:hypothetical protein|nr:hypothetical protein [Candidatus Binatia bacterium]